MISCKGSTHLSAPTLEAGFNKGVLSSIVLEQWGSREDWLLFERVSKPYGNHKMLSRRSGTDAYNISTNFSLEHETADYQDKTVWTQQF